MMINKTIFSHNLWKDTLSVYQKILNLPFITELTMGTLSPKRFAYYMQQDSLYLVDFARALLLIGAKAHNAPHIKILIKFAEGSIVNERALHDYYLDYYKVDSNIEKNNACFAYTHFLISTAATRSLEEAMAAVLPCFWIYREVGHYIYQNSASNNPYEKWISTYTDISFEGIVDEALMIAEEMYETASPLTQTAMKKAVLQSCILEWHFWDDAYNLCPNKMDSKIG